MAGNDEKYVLAIDAGTTGIKAGVYTGNGVRVALANRNNATLSDRPGWNEQDMNRIWDLVCDAVKSVLAKIAPARISAIGITGQGDGLWALTETGSPVRNAILWNDQRAGDVVQEWQQGGVVAEIATKCGTAVWPGSSGPLLRWLKDHEPESYQNMARLCWCKDWIGYQLTGVLATDFTDATIPFLDLTTGRFDAQLLEKCGLADFAEKFPVPKPSHHLLGETRGEANQDLGLETSVPVTVGALDVAAMHVGAGINAIGESLIILGTTAVVSTVVSPHALSDDPVGATVMHPKADRWINVQAPQSGASAMDWLAELNPEKWPGGVEDITRAAAAAEPGSDGVLFLPFLTGERAPFVAPAATGGFLGLTPGTNSNSIARSVLEGVAFSLRHCMDASRASLGRQVLVTGGGANSPIWMQILADILDKTIHNSDEEELGLLGAARLADALEADTDPYRFSPQNAAEGGFEPIREHRKVYEKVYQNYRSVVDQLMPLWLS